MTRRTDPKPAVTVGIEIESKWPGADAKATELAINLFVLNAAVTSFSEALCKKHGVPSPAAFNVLTILVGRGSPLPPSTIAERMIVSRPTMTGIVASLARRRLVRVLGHPSDGRMSLVEVTERGRRLVHAMRPELHAAEKRWMSCLSRREQRELLRILGHLQANTPRVEEKARARH